MSETELPSFFDLPSDTPPEPAPDALNVATAGTTEAPKSEATPQTPQAATPPAQTPFFPQEAIDRMAAMERAKEEARFMQERDRQAAQVWDQILRPQPLNLSAEDKNKLLSDPDALVAFIESERQRTARVAQALYGAQMQSRQETQGGLQAVLAGATGATLAAINTTNSVYEKLASEGYSEVAMQAITEADQALQADPGRYLMHRTDPVGFEAAARYVIAHRGFKPSANPQPSARGVANFGGIGYRPSTPPASSGDSRSFDSGVVESVERTLGMKFRPDTLKRGAA